MILYGDYHTHSNLSDGKETIEQNVKSAVDKHLKQIAITEHGFAHVIGGIKRRQLSEIKDRIIKLRKEYPQIDIFLGIESNIISLKGDLDITPDEVKDFDIVIAGFHKLFKPKTFAGLFNFLIANSFHIFKPSKRRIEKNTQAFINVMNRYDIDILAHLQASRCMVDCVKIAEVAKEKNVYIELNGKRLLFTDKEMLDMVKTGVKFIINSDAHRSRNVGLNNKALNLIERLNIPLEQVANLDKKPIFKRCNKEK